MAPTAKKARYDSALDDVISIVRRSFFGKPVDDEFLTDLKYLMESKLISAGQYNYSFPPKTDPQSRQSYPVFSV